MTSLTIPDFSSFLVAFKAQALQRGDAVALVHGECSLSYAQLDLASDAMAVKLAAQGIGEGDYVALMCTRSIGAITAMISLFKVGAAFVPVDPDLPDERVGFVFDDISVGGIVADDNLSERLSTLKLSDDVPVYLIDKTVNEFDPALAELDIKPDLSSIPSLGDEANNTAYIMYTSGSTGKPKGVLITHDALACYCKADIDAYQLSASDRTLQFSTLSFDIAVEEIFPPLCVGSTVVLRPDERSGAQIELSDIVTRYDITALHLATGYWHEWVDLMMAAASRVPTSLRLMVVTGEKVSPEHYYRWRNLESLPVLWANAYGPTECTVSATVFIPPQHWKGKNMPIGKPLLGYSAYILDSNLDCVESGETGELYIGGPAVSAGYLNRPDLNADVFLADPFQNSAQNGANVRMYKTGDLARWLDHGIIDYAGRIDHQIKVGSYRVEPGEVENTINALTGVLESVVTATSIKGKNQLIAYVATGDSSLGESDIAEHLRESLPAHMLPSRYLLLKSLPKTVNGKIERAALPDVSLAVVARREPKVVSETSTEQKLCDIWCDVLGLPDVSTEDSFISLGGDSLMAVRAISRSQSDLDFTTSTRDFFFLDTIALLAGHIEGRQAPKRVPAPQPVFINKRGRQVYTVLQRPSAHNDNGRGVLLVPPLGNEQRRTQRPFRSLMQNLSRQGYTLMRFDWQGTGDSSGDSEQLETLGPWIQDFEDAVESLASHVSTVDIVAVRMGALIAAQADAAIPSIRQAYYWDPVVSGISWIQDMQRLHNSVLTDSFRFLWPRKINAHSVREFVGLSLNDALIKELEGVQLFSNSSETLAACSPQILSPDDIDLGSAVPACCQVHTVAESNDWLHHRATTRNMLITKAASLLTDLINDSNIDDLAQLNEQRIA